MSDDGLEGTRWEELPSSTQKKFWDFAVRCIEETREEAEAFYRGKRR